MGRLHPHARRALVPDRLALLRLALRVGAGAVHGRPPRLARAREGARRVELDQRDDLPAREPARLREVGDGARARALGLRALPPVLQADGDLPVGRERVPRRVGPARRRARARHESSLRGVPRSRAASRLRADRRRQRAQAGGVRDLRPQHPQRAALERFPRVPATGALAEEPGRDLPCARHAGPLRREARGRGRARERRRLRAGRRDAR